MRRIAFVMLLSGLSVYTNAQSKTVKLVIDSTKIYLRYFYASKRVSDETINDSVRLVARKITVDTFYLDKWVNNKKLWTRMYRIEPAKDSLRVTTRNGAGSGRPKFEYSKQPYYNSFLINN